MNSYVVGLFWACVAVYGVASLAAVWGVVLGRARLLDWAIWIGAVGLAVHTAAIVLRWAAAGRLPVVESFENTLVGAWAISLALQVLVRWAPSVKVAAVVALPFVLLTLGYGATKSPAIPAYLPAYQSNWLVTHVVFAWFTYSSYCLAAALAAAELLKTRAMRAASGGGAAAGSEPGDVSPGDFYDRLPSIPALQDMTFRLVVLGFISNAVMIATGAIWAYKLWGSYWGWDPVETGSLVTWLAYGLYLHLKLTLGWRGPRLAWIALAALLGIAMVFWGVQLFPSSYHLFRQMGAGKIQGPQS